MNGTWYTSNFTSYKWWLLLLHFTSEGWEEGSGCCINKPNKSNKYDTKKPWWCQANRLLHPHVRHIKSVTFVRVPKGVGEDGLKVHLSEGCFLQHVLPVSWNEQVLQVWNFWQRALHHPKRGAKVRTETLGVYLDKSWEVSLSLRNVQRWNVTTHPDLPGSSSCWLVQVVHRSIRVMHSEARYSRMSNIEDETPLTWNKATSSHIAFGRRVFRNSRRCHQQSGILAAGGQARTSAFRSNVRHFISPPTMLTRHIEIIVNVRRAFTCDRGRAAPVFLPAK